MASDRPTDIEHYRERRRRRTREKRMLNNLPLAHRLAAGQAEDREEEQLLLGQALVGLVKAVDAYEQQAPDCRFGAYAEPHIASALKRERDDGEVQVAQAEIAEAISTQERVRELAAFLDVPLDALVGGLMDAQQHGRFPA